MPSFAAQSAPVPPPAPRPAAPQRANSPLNLLMFLRVVLITLLMAMALVSQYRLYPDREDLLSTQASRIIIGAYVLSIVYGVVLRSFRFNPLRFTYVQLYLDLMLCAVVIQFTGGSEGSFTFLYLLVVLSAALLVSPLGALLLSGFAILLVVQQVLRESFALLHQQPGLAAPSAALQRLWLNGLSNIVALIVVASLGLYLNRQLKEARGRLEDTDQRLQSTQTDLIDLQLLYTQIMSSIQSAIIGCSLEQQIMYCNPATERLTGQEGAALQNLPVHALFPGLQMGAPDEPNQALQELPYRGHPDGQERIFSLSVSPLMISHDAHDGWIILVQDLTLLRRMQTAIRRSQHLAALGEMAADIAHELRNPLTGISASVQLLARQNLPPEKIQTLLGLISAESERLNQLISDFLDYTRPHPPRLESLDLAILIEEVVTLFRAELDAERGLTLRLDLQPALTVRADPAKVRQVLWNLLKNAADASPEAGTIEIRGERVAAQPGRSAGVCVRIIDEGEGIAPALREQIFTPFYTTKARGTGLGLATVSRILHAHGGLLQVESEPHKGSSFNLHFVDDPDERPLTGPYPEVTAEVHTA